MLFLCRLWLSPEFQFVDELNRVLSIIRKSIEERIAELSVEEKTEIISQMGMNMTDHPYLSEERRQELQDEEKKQIEPFKNRNKAISDGL